MHEKGMPDSIRQGAGARSGRLKIYYITYPLSVKVKGTLNQPLIKANVVLLSEGRVLESTESQNDGYATFEKVPLGSYTIRTKYKGMFVEQALLFDGAKETEVSIDVFFEILNIPMTTMQSSFLLVVVFSFTEWVAKTGYAIWILAPLGCIISLAWFFMMGRTFDNLRHFTSVRKKVK